MKMWLFGLSCLLSACGGKGQVDLGGNEGWANTRASDAAAVTAPMDAGIVAHQAQTLYGGEDTVIDIAVDETTIAARIHRVEEWTSRIDLCRFENCQGTRLTIDSVSPMTPYSTSGLVISHGEVFWLRLGGQQLTNELAGDPNGQPVLIDSNNALVGPVGSTPAQGPYTLGNGSTAQAATIMACATSGCPEGPRQIASDDSPFALAADADYVYWLRAGAPLQVVRCARNGCQNPDAIALPEDVVLGDVAMSADTIVIDEAHHALYLAGSRAIGRMPTDFTAPPAIFHEDTSKLAGLSVVGDYVYFARSTLVGQILRCPVAGCDAEPELVVSAPRWPSGVVADERAIYWNHRPESSRVASDSAALSATSLSGGSSEPVSLVDGFRSGAIDAKCIGPVINSHHLYWCEVTGASGSELTLSIRTMKR